MPRIFCSSLISCCALLFGIVYPFMVPEILISKQFEIKKGLYSIFPNKYEWTERDLNPRPPPCEGGDLPLIYQPDLEKGKKDRVFDYFH